MPAKRSRLMRSSSTGDVELVTPSPRPPPSSHRRMSPIIPPPNSIAKPKSADQPRPPIFSIPSPVYDQPVSGTANSDRIGSFFDQCYYCNKKIGPNGDVYMYSVRAFCSTECREKQMYIEEGLGVASKRARDAIRS